MKNNKLDISQLIGFALIGAVLVWYSLTQKETPATPVTDKKEVVAKKSNPNSTQNYLKKHGVFAHSILNHVDPKGVSTLENDVLKLKIANKGGQIVEAEVKNHKTYDNELLYLIKNANASLNLSFVTQNNQKINTKNLIFEPTLSKNGNDQVLTLKLKVSNNQYLSYKYTLKPNDYMLDFDVQSSGLENIIKGNQPVNLEWKLAALRHEKSIKYENQMTALHFEKEEDKYDDLSVGGYDDANETGVNWIGFKQHFFSTILVSNQPFEKATLKSLSLVKDETKDTLKTKKFSAKVPLMVKNGKINYNFKMYIGPNDYNTLKSYDLGIENVMNLGWGIFGWINKIIFIPIFNLLGSFISNYGLVIILMTLVVRLLMSPLVYKSYVSSAKMKVLKPEMEAINAKFPGKENQMKRQTEIMALQRKSGVNMMAGCIPALLQMPVFFALFRFFPSEIDLRQKAFLWADDLSSYDSVFEWTTNIPIISNFYGNHFSLFPVLASLAIFFYMKMNQDQQMSMQQPAQEGMPDMQKLMKMMMYMSPIMMLFFFNNYASGLSLYYFISNLLTLAIMYVIKNFVIDEEKILAKIHENRQKPMKQSKFKQRLEEAMKQAQEQQAKNKK